MAKQLKNLKQYNVRIRQELIDKLDALAIRYRAESGNKIAGEVIERYLSFWEAAELVRQQTIEQQRAHLTARKQPIVKAKPKPTKLSG